MRGNGLGQRCSPYRKTWSKKYYINARKRIDIEKLIHFERDSLTGIVLVRVPLSSRTFAFKVESYRRMSWTSPNSTPPSSSFFPFQRLRSLSCPYLTVWCLHPGSGRVDRV